MVIEELEVASEELDIWQCGPVARGATPVENPHVLN